MVSSTEDTDLDHGRHGGEIDAPGGEGVEGRLAEDGGTGAAVGGVVGRGGVDERAQGGVVQRREDHGLDFGGERSEVAG